MTVVLLKNCLENSKRIINSWNRSKRRWRIISKLKEVHSLDSISYLMTNCLKFYRKLEILMQYRHILENALTISIESNLLMSSNRSKSYQWLLLSLRQCLKLSAFPRVSSLKALYKIGWWEFKRWWLNRFMMLLSKHWRNILMTILWIDRNGYSLIIRRIYCLLIWLNGLRVWLKLSWMRRLIRRKVLSLIRPLWRRWLPRW